MTCPSCQHENRPTAKFCGGCGASLPRTCRQCGADLPPGIRFCDECGTPVAASPPTAQAPAPPPAEGGGARKIVTILFADLVGSTALHERLDPESARRFMESYYAAAREAVERQGGTVTQFLGDGVKAVFGIPRVAEDDAIRAVRAGVAMQEAFRALAEAERGAIGATGLRVAVNTGEVVVHGESEIIGDPVNVAARLQERGRDGDVVLGEATRRLVSGQVTLDLLGSFDLKGRSVAVRAWRVASLDPPRAAATPFVGREEELGRLETVYERAIATPATRLAVLLGSPGLGKSRLLEELARRHEDTATVVTARCDAAGGSTFAPLAEALREHLGVDAGASTDSLRAALEAALPDGETDRTRVAAGVAALLAGSPGVPEETFFVVRRFLAGLAASRPVVFVIDDLQWAEPLLLDLIEHLVQWGRGLPLLVLVGARPELREVRTAFAMPGGLVSDVVTLDGLDAGAAMRLAAGVVGATDLPAAVAAKVLATSEGNPLFIGELVRMLVDEGALTREGDRWTAGEKLATVEMPPTIHALLAARIERLDPGQCLVLERAAVVGRQFSRSAVAALLPDEGAGLDAQIEALRRAELIERDAGWLLGEPVLRFHHVLIRDAAYRRLLKGTRAELHERLANWIEARVGDASEHDEMIGRHLEEAHRLLGELGPVEEAGRRLGKRAAERLAAAGRRALEGDDVPLAANLLGRALERRSTDDPARADLAIDWCESLLAAGDVARAAEAIAELDRVAGDSARLRAWHTCFSGEHTVMTAPERLQDTVQAVAAAAASLASLEDTAGEAKAHFVHALALARLGQVGACEASLDRALAAARRADDRRRANNVLAIAPLAALWGPSPVTRASGRCLDVVRVLRITQGAPAVEAVALNCQGALEALRGRSDAARRMIAAARKMVEELGIAHRLYEADVFAARIEAMEGNAAEAERLLRPAYDGLRDLGLGIDAARAAALLARTVLAQGRVDEAVSLSQESEALAGDDLQAAIAWRCVRAEALASRAEGEAAVEIAEAAVGLAAATDALLNHAEARAAHAAALRAAGREEPAHAEEQRALDLRREKGATLLLEATAAGLPGTGSNDALPETATPKTGADDPPSPAPTLKGDGPQASSSRGGVPEASTPVGAHRRWLRANAATQFQQRFDAAFAARDLAALRALLGVGYREIDHTTGVELGPDEALSSVERLLRSHEPFYRVEPLATLGEFLLLSRRRTGASGASGRRYDVGVYENEVIQLIEVDVDLRWMCSESFAPRNLGDAIARLFERHAELLFDGAESDRATGAARSLAATFADPPQLADWTAMLAPDVGCDDRRLLGFGTLEPGKFVEICRAQFELEDFRLRCDEVLGLTEHAVCLRLTTSGTSRESGGALERRYVDIWEFRSDGRVGHVSPFDLEQEAEALARFEELTGRRAGPGFSTGTPIATASRRIRRNAATAEAERLYAPLSAGDLTVLRRHATYELIDHTTGKTYGMDGLIASLEALFRSRDPWFRWDSVAALGDSLVLVRQSSGASGSAGRRHDVGPFENVIYQLFEVGDGGTFLRSEIFADDRLGDALARLYERHAELLPGGPDRDGAEIVARIVKAVTGTPDLDAWMANASPEVEFVDHRTLGFGVLRGFDEVRKYYESFFETSEDVFVRLDDTIAVEENALLVRWTAGGTVPEGGGEAVRTFLLLHLYGLDGLLRRIEYFDSNHGADALVRFDEVTGGVRGEPWGGRFENAAFRAAGNLVDCFNARDWAGVESLAAPDLVFDERRRLVRNTCGREVWLEQFRVLFDLPKSHFSIRLVDTRGERLVLSLHDFTGEVTGGGGPLALEEHFVLYEIDDHHRISAIVLFDREDEEAACAELDTLFGAGEGASPPPEPAVSRRRPVRANTATRVQDRFDDAIGRSDLSAVRALMSDDFREVDHTTGVSYGPDDAVHSVELLLRSRDPFYRVERLATLGESLLLACRRTGASGASGRRYDVGPYENEVMQLIEVDGEGLMWRLEAFAPRNLGDAVARLYERYAELLPEGPERRRVEVTARSFSAWTGRIDRDQVAESMTPSAPLVDHRVLAPWTSRDAAEVLENTRLQLELASKWELHVEEVLALDPDGILVRVQSDGTLRSSGGRFENHALLLLVFGVDGRVARLEVFEGDGEAGAGAEALARFDELTGRRTGAGSRMGSDEFSGLRGAGVSDPVSAPGGTRRWTVGSSPFENAAVRAFARQLETFEVEDWRAFADRLPDDFRFEDRTPMTQLALDRERYVAYTREILERVSAFRGELEVIATRGDRLALLRLGFEGEGRDVGPSRVDDLSIIEADEEGRFAARIRFDPGDLDAALAELEERWDAIVPATHTSARRFAVTIVDALSRHDREEVRRLVSPDFVGRDGRLTGWGEIHGIDAYLGVVDALVDLAPDARLRVVHARVSERGMLAEISWEGTRDGGAFELPMLSVWEIDDRGRGVRLDLWDPQHLDAALARFAETGVPRPRG